MLKECVVCVATSAFRTRFSDASNVTTASNTRIVATTTVNHRSRRSSVTGAKRTKPKPPNTLVLPRNQAQNPMPESAIDRNIQTTRSSNTIVKRVVRRKGSHPPELLLRGLVLEGTSFSRMSCVKIYKYK
ncbi:hypothetical protein Ccrd_006760 [Cynara cardunculus var. scolymus]|uniref:Uncharacterized protein n=1 Tax=Cynara cardunculus var. scolymus TaxID=59895 RepID=A0A103XIB0_CYNCS|nr:hypothetical protein Ccrd_006760 [Cynara cardunculus var. scolymus]